MPITASPAASTVSAIALPIPREIPIMNQILCSLTLSLPQPSYMDSIVLRISYLLHDLLSQTDIMKGGPKMRGSDFAEFKAFAAVAEHGSFVRAAQQLGVYSIRPQPDPSHLGAPPRSTTAPVEPRAAFRSPMLEHSCWRGCDRLFRTSTPH